MHAVILNGQRHERMLPAAQPMDALLSATLAAAGWKATTFALRAMRIADCTGCFGCWLKLPGICVIPDDAREVAAAITSSNLAVLLTPITFGGYSSELKKALDRVVCSLALPFFQNENGLTRHVPRYRHYPDLMGIGLLPQPCPESEALFADLFRRNALNMRAHQAVHTVIFESDSTETARGKINLLCSQLKGLP